MIVYLARAIQAFVMYCVNGTSRSSLLIVSTDSMISKLYCFIPGNYCDEKKAASQADSKASVDIATVKQKKRALNRMYYHVHKQKLCLQKREKYVTNSDDKKVVSRAYSKAIYSINPQKNHALPIM